MNRRDRHHRGPGLATTGLTLVELMAVVTLLSFVLGVGLGMFAGLDPGRRIALSQVQNTLRAAHTSSVGRADTARVRFEREAGRMVAEKVAVVGTWHFEGEDLAGAFELDGAAHGMDQGFLSPDGYQGSCLDLDRQPEGARVEIQVQKDPAYDFGAGFALDFALRLEEDRAAKLFDVGRVLLVGVRRQGVLEASFLSEVEGEAAIGGTPAPGGKIVLRTPPASLHLGQWARVRVAYDRDRFTISVDGVTVASVEEQAPVWKVEHPLVIGGGQTSFPGRFDSLVISAVHVAEPILLPEGVRFGTDTPDEVLFAAGGALDPRRHRAPVEVPLEFADGQRQVVQVNLYGTVE